LPGMTVASWGFGLKPAMKTGAETIQEFEAVGESRRTIIQLPLGLLGFESIKRYVLISDPEEAPFLWLQVEGETDLAFLVVSPFEVTAEYEPSVSVEDLRFLGLESADDALFFNIVTLDRRGGGTVNLKGPIVVNPQTLVGKQCIPLNASQLSVKHPIPSVQPQQ
jgi:flagellar assembly factor FliW